MKTLEALKLMRKKTLEQGYPSRDGMYQSCHYWKNNRACVIGMICPDVDLKKIADYTGNYDALREEMYRPWMEDLDTGSMLSAQSLHDTLEDKGWLVNMIKGLDKLIKEIE